MSVRTKAAASLLAVLAAYLAGAVLSGHMSPFARRPLLDGTGPPAPYNWVNPPPALAPTNKPAESGSYTVTLKGASQPGVFQTNDRQAVLILPTGAIPKSAGATSIQLTLQPLNPAGLGSPPKGQAIAGNVYLIKGVYQPGGSKVTRLSGGQSEAALIYPLTASTKHTLIQSKDGKTWTKLPSTDQLANHQVLATKVTQLGYFAVAVPASGASPVPTPTSSGGIGGILTWIIAGVALIVLILALRAEYMRRRNAREQQTNRNKARRRH